MIEETNLLSSYLVQRQRFYDLLYSIQEKYLQWFTERESVNGQQHPSLVRDYVDCNLDLSTRVPKLKYNPDLDSNILEECSDAFCVAFDLS
ncbi:hypothetical protein KHS38_04120 [Mucilaginibacter sp. Bleaf8]|uniref:hypothetical protein n=1 Tax=Mucilaginibacter sp. Bleaf8 TaxID=2834430 RepID=UPI001BCAAD0C|nr:hypothetical protein [Mucilaginibacter sp. Bleaf8]MBS7563584.1 hypothetical protein [Mucilaginibacter sp. Bleaf8]